MNAIDLFAGLGGFSEGAQQAGCRVLWASNHWRAAVDIHESNHPETEHVCQDLQQADWSQVPWHNLLLASPACQGHTPARGKERPHHDATRSTAWAVVSAAEFHRPYAVVVENVVQFVRWALYPAWCSAMHALGYAGAPMILDAADHGVPQNRKRLFVVFTRSKHPIDLRLPKREHVPAANIIQFDTGRWSAIDRPGRSPATLRRIESGRRAFGRRFVMPYYSNGSGLTGRSLARPIGTITTRDRWAIIDGDRMRMLSKVEARRAMAFRDDYELPAQHRPAIYMLGNAVPPPVARDVISALKAAA